ncbi:hypothetical protein CYMTET_44850 [Cymbomonas tetramitiformis]|uniref:Uncharacterized protein n=1 Tax=Cymbomonas tetramitiformis TaxID=36881 RepID=A0AAE0EZ64_9CHLO|nr:hypothetical protein CYMTET_44850 [Cymbomonas tetramitiformis]
MSHTYEEQEDYDSDQQAEIEYEAQKEPDSCTLTFTGISGVEYSVCIKSEFDPECKWIANVEADVTASGNSVGALRGSVFNRWSIKGENFHGLMDEPSQEICDMALALFTKNGQLKAQHRGTFGKEIDCTKPKHHLLYLAEIELEPAVYVEVIGPFLQKLQSTSGEPSDSDDVQDLARVRFHHPHDIEAYVAKSDEMRKARRMRERTHFNFVVTEDDSRFSGFEANAFRRTGFRRIGATNFFGCCTDRTHACWNTEEPDLEPAFPTPQPVQQTENSLNIQLRKAATGGIWGPAPWNPEEETLLSHGPCNISEIKKLVALGASIQHSVALFKAVANTHLEALEVLQELGGDINLQDDQGNTPLHVAAMLENEPAIAKLIALGANASPLNRARETPAQALQAKMKSDREFASSFGVFRSHSEKSLRCLQLLNITAALQPPAANPSASSFAANTRPSIEPRLQSGWGCTCAECISGWFSPRMHFRLKICAEVSADIITDSINEANFQRGRPLSREDADVYLLDSHVPMQVIQEGYYKSFAQGFQQCFRAMHALLVQGVAPTPALIQKKLSSGGWFDENRGAVQHYLDRGGTPDHALDALLTRSKEENEATGDGSFEDVPDFAAQLACLPECDNDDDYELLRARLLPASGRFGQGSAPLEQM